MNLLSAMVVHTCRPCQGRNLVFVIGLARARRAEGAVCFGGTPLKMAVFRAWRQRFFLFGNLFDETSHKDMRPMSRKEHRY